MDESSKLPVLQSAIADRVPLAFRARTTLDVKAVMVIVLAGLLGAAIGLIYLLQGRPEPIDDVMPPVVSAQAVAPAGGSPAPSQIEELVVDVEGRVRQPGIVRVPAGSRVIDAIEAAGGAEPGTDMSALNLARKLSDGEQIFVGVPPPPGAEQPPVGAADPVTEVLDLNTATLEQLETLPGVGPVLAQRIIDYRTAHGGFRSVDQLREVTGIGEQRFAELKELVRV